MQARTQWTYSDVWSQLATTPEWSFTIGDQQNEKKWWNSDQRAIWNAMRWIDAGRRVIRHQGVSDGYDRARPLWRSHSPRTDIFLTDAILLDYLTSEVALEEPEIWRTDPNILIDINCMDGEVHFGMPGGSWDDEDEGDESDVCDAILTPSQRRQPATELERFDLGTSDVNRYGGEDGDDADEDEEEEALQANDGSTQNVEDWGRHGFDLRTSDVDGYECEHGDDADADE